MIKEHHQFELWGKKVFEKAVIEPPFRVIAPMPNEACYYHVVTGHTRMITPTEKIDQVATDGVVLRCGTYLNEYLTTSEADYCEAIAVHFHPDILRMIYDKEFPTFLTDETKVTPAMYDRVKSSELIKTYIDSLQFYFENPELVSDELLRLKLKEAILLLAKTDNAQMIRSMLNGLFVKTDVNFKAIVEANVYGDLSLNELSALCNLSLSSLKREFTKHYGLPPAKYMKKRKLEKAARLLKSTALRVSSIAYDCGFSDSAHFARSFQSHYSVSPTKYRLG